MEEIILRVVGGISWLVLGFLEEGARLLAYG